MVFRTRVIVRLGTQNRMVTKGYRKGVYDRVTTGTAANWKPPESWRPGAGVPTPIRYTRPSIPIRLSSEETVVRTGLTVIAHVTAKTGQEDLVRQALLDLVAPTRKEKGCINYDLHQSQENATQFAVYENWETAADLDSHAKSAHLQAFARIAAHLLERPAEISKWIMVSELKDNNPSS
jgi:quinol monooxygenase YgiN